MSEQENTEGYVRDSHSNAVVCADVNKRDIFMRKRSEKQRIHRLEESCEEVKMELAEIKNMLNRILKENT